MVFVDFVYSSLKVNPDETEMINIHLEVAKVLVPASGYNAEPYFVEVVD